MALLRAAFECENGLAQIVVLCAGCYAEVAGRIDAQGIRRWSHSINSGVCEFCLDEIRESALR